MYKVWIHIENVEDETDCYDDGCIESLFLDEFSTEQAACDYARTIRRKTHEVGRE